MNTGIISHRYAKALYSFASESGLEKEVYQEMITLSQSYMEVKELRSVMVNPVVTVADKISLICCAAGGNVSSSFERFVQLVVKENREKFFQFMAVAYIDIYRFNKNIKTGRLITALPVSSAVFERLKKIITDRTHAEVEFQSNIDESLIGGFILDVDTYRIDASVSSQMNAIRREFEQKNSKLV